MGRLIVTSEILLTTFGDEMQLDREEWAEDKQLLYDVKLSVIRGYCVYYLPIDRPF